MLKWVKQIGICRFINLHICLLHKKVQKLVEGENWSSECDLSTRIETLTQVKKELESKNGSENAIHFVDILMQHSELQTLTNAEGATLRDQFMAENVQWILQQEQ